MNSPADIFALLNRLSPDADRNAKSVYPTYSSVAISKTLSETSISSRDYAQGLCVGVLDHPTDHIALACEIAPMTALLTVCADYRAVLLGARARVEALGVREGIG